MQQPLVSGAAREHDSGGTCGVEQIVTPDANCPSNGTGAAAAAGNVAAPSSRSPSKHARLASLDVVRGFTVALMIFVDDVGDAYPALNHSPWNNVTLADCVMPFFLFMVGTSLAMSLRRFKVSRETRLQGTRFVTVRAVKLFALGVLLQGGGWISDYTYGFNLAIMRWCGILQRIGYSFWVAALLELWLPELETPAERPHLGAFYVHAWKWLAATVFVVLHLVLTYGVKVPSWTSYWGWDPDAGGPALLAEPFTVQCDVRGAVDTPECSAAGFFDRLLLGQNHLGVWMSARLPQCSSCSPGDPNPLFRPDCHYNLDDAHRWCFAYIYDPEGTLSSLPTVMSVWLGSHFGRVASSQGIARGLPVAAHWSAVSALLLATGLIAHAAGLPMNKQLWSTSYLLFMAGACGAVLTAVYALIDATGSAAQARISKVTRQVLWPFEMMGMNAILVFFWHGTAEALLNAAYWAPPKVGGGFEEKGVVEGQSGWIFTHVLAFISDPAPRQLVYVLLKVACFLVGTWVCYRRGYFWKI